MSVRTELQQLLSERIVILDGAMGTALQGLSLQEEDFRGDLFKDHPTPLKGCNDLLCLTRPDAVIGVHTAYIEAGADIIETNTFNATAVSMADYGLQSQVHAINVAAAQCARKAADAAMAASGRRIFVAGSMGPTSKTASLSPDVNDPAFRAVDFDALKDSYYEQVCGLVEGGVDLLLPETTFDTLNLKASLFAIEQYFADHAVRLPTIASVTITDRSGRTLSGQTVEAFWLSIEHADLIAVAMNCALGAAEMRPHLEELASIAPIPVLAFPNAGLPNEMAEYDQTPQEMAEIVATFAEDGLINMAGGCCGTTPPHIAAVAAALKDLKPRDVPAAASVSRWSGLEPYTIFEGTTFTMVGERTNVSGSRRFRNLIKADDYEGATKVARKQVEGGANIIDVNMDDGLLDGPKVMTVFLNQIAAEPDIARVPVMIDSSRFEVIEAGLKCVQGKSIVNSLSLKEGEAEFLRQAAICRRYGAAVVVMAFDETGQATETEGRIAICERAYKLLTEKAGFAGTDIIFDPNILAIGTGMAEHDDYGVSFIEATRGIKARCPGALVSGGVSNLSFSFRGNNVVREAIHAVFLYHAIQAGMDMGIVNAGQLAVYDEVQEPLLTLVEDLVLNRRPDATERLIEFGEQTKGVSTTRKTQTQWRQGSLEDRVKHALLTGNTDYIDADMAEALTVYPAPLSIIEGPLMDGMSVVGDLFGAGKMFLPQVVKSARVMKKAVAHLEPYMEDAGEGRTSAGKIVMATVKGDVHDIGKNIVGVVLRCNGYEVIDLGVMVPCDRILDTAVAEQADLIGLSGLITPSLDEMVHVAHEMTRRGAEVPLLIGGATTSKKHTAVKIAPQYEQTTLHVLDASRAVTAVSRLMNPAERVALDAENRAEQTVTRERFEARRKLTPLLSLTAARNQGLKTGWDEAEIATPDRLGTRAFAGADIEEIERYIDWGPFFTAWELKASWRKQLEDPEVGPRYRELLDDARALIARFARTGEVTLSGAWGFYAAAADGDDIVVYRDDSRTEEQCRFHMLRQQEQRPGKRTPYQCLADLIAPLDSGREDTLGAFAVTAGTGLDKVVAEFEANHDDYNAILAKAVADRLAEALTERVHEQMREAWGFADDGLKLDDLLHSRFRGIRPAPGYPACPDHTEKRTLFDLLDAESAGVSLTEHFAMLPAASVSGLVFAHPQARYFGVGRVGRDQVEDYARRKGMRLRAAERWLGPNLGYELEQS